MTRFIVRRLLLAVPTLFGITVLSFAVMHLAPGDPVALYVGEANDTGPADIAALREAYALDQPLPLQYTAWLGHIARGDLGRSLLYKRPVAEMIAMALPNTLQLSLLALAVSLAVGIPLGLLAARYRGTPVDHAIRVLGATGHAVPAFWLGLLFILVFSVQLRLFPVGGMLTTGAGSWDLGDRLRHLVGPVLVLAMAGIANYSRYVRTETLDALRQDFIRTARAKGLSEHSVLYAHALRNALLPIVTALGAVLAHLVSGSIVVEQVFAWPGMGRMSFDAARAKDYPVVMAVVLIVSALLILSFLVRDVAYGLVDPRVRRHQ